MGSDWLRVSLDELYEFSSGLSKPRSDFGSGYPFLSFKDVFYNSAVPKLTELVNSTERERLRCSVKRGDVFLTRTSETMDELGMSSVALMDVPNATFNGFTKRLRPKDERSVLPEFARYYFRSPEFRNSVTAMSSMSTRASLNNEMLARLTMVVPSLSEQRAIAAILGALDDKIELNREMSETLKGIARAIFKSWFIDFEPVRAKMEKRWQSGQTIPSMPAQVYNLFCDSFKESALGSIPKDWTIKTINDIAERVAMGPFGSSIKVSTFVSEGVPIISGQHLRDFVLEDNTFNFITHEHAEKLRKAIVQRGDIVFTHAGNIGQVALIPTTSRYDEYVISQRQFFMRCDSSQVNPEFVALYFNSPFGQHQLLANTSSSGVPSIARPVTYLRSIPIVVPPKELLDYFQQLISPILQKFQYNKKSNADLTLLRDRLLPKLISGELRVKDAEKVVAGSVR